MSDETEPVDQYRQRAARLRSLASDCVSRAIVERLLGMALRYDDFAKRCGLQNLYPPRRSNSERMVNLQASPTIESDADASETPRAR